MTTLPQTTTLRLPRPASNTQLSIPSGPAGLGILPQAANPNQMTGADIWRVLRANMWLIVLMLMLSGVAGYFANYYLAKYHSRYTATALVAITPPMSLDPSTPMDRPLDIISLQLQQQTTVNLLKEPSLISEVLGDPDSPIRDTGWLRSFNGNMAKAKNDLAANLGVSARPNTSLISVEMSSRSGDDCKKIIKAVIDQHMLNQEKENSTTQKKRSVLLTAMNDRYEQRHSELSDDLNAKQVDLNITGNSGSARMNVKDMEMSEFLRMKIDAEQKANIAQEQLDLLKSQMAAGRDPEKVAEAVSKDPEVQKYRSYVSEVEMRIAMETQAGDSSPTMIRMKKQLELFNSKLTDAESNVRRSAQTMLEEATLRDVDLAKKSVDDISDRIKKLDDDISKLNKELGDYYTENAELTAVDTKRKQVQDQLEQISRYTSQKDLTNVEWKSLPEASDIPTFPNLNFVMFVALTLGLTLSLGIAFIREMLDTTVRSPRDITRVGQMNLLGMIPHEDDDPQSQGARLPLVIFEAPQSMMAEQLRQVRTRLQHAASLDTTRSILITSPSPDDGKSTIAANLASGLALNGRRILLVDANFRRPSLHRTFNLGNDHGFSDVLNSLELFETTVQETQVPNLYVLPSGLKPTNATELLESQLLLDFIERALEEFDHVIFDSGPLLFVSETVALAPRVDGVVTVVRARTNTRGVLQRMRDSLRQIKAEHLGVVLNAVRSHGGGYYRNNIRAYYDYQNDRAA